MGLTGRNVLSTRHNRCMSALQQAMVPSGLVSHSVSNSEIAEGKCARGTPNARTSGP